MSWRFNTNSGLLISPSEQTWPARSGPHGRGRLPNGQYKIGRVTILSSGDRSFQDMSGLAWWCPISPGFQTDRNGLGIHPDGGIAGTLGCIGITSTNTRSAYDALRSANGATLVVE